MIYQYFLTTKALQAISEKVFFIFMFCVIAHKSARIFDIDIM